MAAIATTMIDGIAVMRPHGRFVGGEETDELERALDGLEAARVPAAVINLKDVSYLGTPGLGALVRAYKRFSWRQARVVLCEVDRRIWNVLVITKLCLLFETFPTEKAALDALRADVAPVHDKTQRMAGSV
jgi:anti-anti-sigma factor